MNAVVREVDNPFGKSVVAQPTGTALEQALMQREVTEVQTMALMAKRFPRNPVVAMDRILQACARPSLAEAATYEYSKGGTEVSGASIRLAEAIAQNWGNILTGIDIIAGDERKSECIAYAWDMETGARDQKRFTVKHWRDKKDGGGYWLKDEREIYELCANMGARRKRACILAVIPGDVVEAAVDQCDVTLKTKVDITPEYIKSLQGAFEKFGVTTAMLEKLIQRRIDTLTPALALRLKRIHQSLKDGMSEPAAWFDMTAGAPAETAGEEKPQGGVAGVREQLKKGQRPAKKDEPPYQSEEIAILAVDGAADREAALVIVDACRGLPFEESVRTAVDNRYPPPAK